jgi:L-gulonolactone oxidase
VLAAATVGLGAFGIVANVTLQCVPAFALEADERPEGVDDVLAELDAFADGSDHAEFYWFPHTRRVLSKRNTRRPGNGPLQPLGRVRRAVDDEFLSNTVFELVNRVTTRRPALVPRANAVAARALTARRYTDRSYRVFATARRVVFREMEYAVPRAAVPGVLTGIQAWLAASGQRIGFPVEVRFAAADDVWLSTASGRDTAYVAVHQYWRRGGAVPRRRRPAALGQAARAERRRAAAALPALRRGARRPRPAGPGPGLRQHVHGAGSRALTSPSGSG